MPIKSTTTTKRKKRKKSKRIYRTSQNIRIINVFLESLLSAQILIWPYTYVILPPMSTAIRTSAFSFVGTVNDL